MSAVIAPSPGAGSAGARKLANFRLIPRIETYPNVVSFAQTSLGKVILLVTFGACLRFFDPWPWQIVLFLAAMSFLPDVRRLLVTMATVAVTVTSWEGAGGFSLWMIAAVYLLGALLFCSAATWRHSWYGRRPVFILLSGFALLIATVSVLPEVRNSPVAWDFIFMLSGYVWFIGFSLMDLKSKDRDTFLLQLGTYRPFWGSTVTPYPKGAAYLRRIEVRNSEELAIVQLKGLKLLVWAILISLLATGVQRFFHGYLDIPTFTQALERSAKGSPLPWHLAWASLILNFFEGLMAVSILGHRIIAICRIAGFNALRNTYRPLSSVTVAEFFNRYYFYFKELLVDFFFYPVFLRYFKPWRRVRIAAAIFAAACFGNAYYHFTRDLSFIRNLGLWGAFVGYQVYLFYCVALATGITISQLRRRKPAPAGFVRARLLPACSVALFYCLLDIFGSTQRNYPLIEHFRFLGHLFCVNV